MFENTDNIFRFCLLLVGVVNKGLAGLDPFPFFLAGTSCNSAGG